MPPPQTVKKAMNSSKVPQPSRITIAPGGVYGGRGRMPRRKIPFS